MGKRKRDRDKGQLEEMGHDSQISVTFVSHNHIYIYIHKVIFLDKFSCARFETFNKQCFRSRLNSWQPNKLQSYAVFSLNSKLIKNTLLKLKNRFNFEKKTQTAVHNTDLKHMPASG